MKNNHQVALKIHNRSSHVIPALRLIAGFTLSPIIGPFFYYMALIVLSLFNVNLLGRPIQGEFLELLAVPLLSTLLFYAPAVLFGTCIMMLIRRFYSWNIITSILGAMMSAFSVALLFFVLIGLSGAGMIIAKTGFFLVFNMIAVPSMLAGVSFWLITVYRNYYIDSVLGTNTVTEFPSVSSRISPVDSATTVIADSEENSVRFP